MHMIAQEFGKLVLGLESKKLLFTLAIMSTTNLNNTYNIQEKFKCVYVYIIYVIKYNFRVLISDRESMVLKVLSATCTNGSTIVEEREATSDICKYFIYCI